MKRTHFTSFIRGRGERVGRGGEESTGFLSFIKPGQSLQKKGEK